jgi:hypothetical protein
MRQVSVRGRTSERRCDRWGAGNKLPCKSGTQRVTWRTAHVHCSLACMWKEMRLAHAAGLLLLSRRMILVGLARREERQCRLLYECVEREALGLSELMSQPFFRSLCRKSACVLSVRSTVVALAK